MKAQTTCSASYVNISLMFISFTENFFFFFECVLIPVLPRPEYEMPDYHKKA